MAFATADDVRKRLGRESLTAAEQDQASLLVESATALIAEAVGEDDDWATALDPVPGAVKALCVEIVIRAMANPAGLRSFSETLGSYSISESFASLGIMLSPDEVELLRRVLSTDHGQASSEPETIIDQAIIDLGAVSAGAGSLRDLGADDPAFYLGS